MVNPTDTREAKLLLHEWLAVLSLLLFLTAMTVVAMWRSGYVEKSAVGEEFPLFRASVEVLIEGAVENPGIFKVQSGSIVSEVLSQVHLLPEADLKRIKLQGKLKNGQIIKIPFKAKIELFVRGAVKNPGKIAVPKGLRLNELRGYIELEDHAEVKYLDKKRKLKQGEELHIPVQKSTAPRKRGLEASKVGLEKQLDL